MSLKPYRAKTYKGPWQKRFRNYYKGGRQIYRDIGTLTGGNTEFKWEDVSFTGQAVGTTSSVFPLINLGRGTDAVNRIGRSIRMKSAQLQLTFTLDTAQSADQLRIVLVKEKFTGGTAVTYSGGTAKSIFTTSNFDSLRDLNNRENIQILSNKFISLTNDGVEKRTVKLYKKFNYHVIFNGSNNADITDIQSGALYLVILGNLSNITNPTLMSGYIRLRFLDD